MAPLGWAALAGRVTGEASDGVTVNALSVGAASPGRRSCDQKARLDFRGASAEICLEGRLVGESPKEGAQLQVVGRVSRFGLVIDELQAR